MFIMNGLEVIKVICCLEWDNGIGVFLLIEFMLVDGNGNNGEELVDSVNEKEWIGLLFS